MTTRDAINEILLSINELPLDATDDITDIQTAIIVNEHLSIAKRRVLSYGWNFNTTYKSLTPQTNLHIVIPSTYLSVDAGADYDVRQSELFDKVNYTFEFTDSIDATVIEDVDFSDVPYVIANYIIKEAALNAYISIIGDDSNVTLRHNAMVQARNDAFRENARKIGGNVLTKDYATDLLDRTGI